MNIDVTRTPTPDSTACTKTTNTPVPPSCAHTRPQDLADETVHLVRKWLTEAAQHPNDPAAERLAGVLSDPTGLDFTVGFVDGVVRPEDFRAAAHELRKVAPLAPKFLPAHLRGAIRIGAAAAPALPRAVVPIARKVLRRMVSHLIIDASEAKLGAAIKKLRQDDVRLNINLLGEAILGEHEAARRLDGTLALLRRADVDYVSIKVSATVAPHNHWAFDDAVDHIEAKLLPLFTLANNSSPQKFINLDMEEYKDLDLTIAVFKRILERPEFTQLAAGIVLQAYLPDALDTMMSLQSWAALRVEAGGAPIKVRVVKGANLPMEHVDAAVHGWPAATWPTKQASDTSYKAVIDYALTPERVRNVRIGVAGHNLFDVALAWLLANARGASDGIEFEMLLGMATGQAAAVKRDVGALLLYTPVVHPAEFDVAIAYLIRRLEEGASPENFMSAVFELNDNAALFEREEQRFRASLDALSALTGDGTTESYTVPSPNRQQDRRAHRPRTEPELRELVAAGAQGLFENEADTDPDLPGNRAWGLEITRRMATSELGVDLVRDAQISSAAALNDVIERGLQAAPNWQQLSSADRALILYRAAEELAARRSELLEVMGQECGKTLDQGDPEISEAVDFARYYAMLGQQIEKVDGAAFTPAPLIAVIPPWNFPVAIAAGGVLAGLAAGSAVIIKPARSAARSGALMVEALWKAGVPRDVLQLVQFNEAKLGQALISDTRIERVILTGAYETAVKFREFRPDLPLLAETSGKNAIIVTPNADLDLAAKDVALSAFGHAGQKCSAASLVVLVGSVARSSRFRGQLIDAVRSLRVGSPDEIETQLGPIIAPPSGKLLRGLTTLGTGERWLVKPAPVQHTSPLTSNTKGITKLWSPGVRIGVQPGSEFHRTEYFGPVLGIMTAATLDAAIDLVNDTDYGLTSGIHSLDQHEVRRWLDRIAAGNLYVNRGITGAIVRRQSFGGWKKSAIGPGTKAGGPNYLHAFGDWQDAPVHATTKATHPSVREIVSAANSVGLSATQQRWLAHAVRSDAAAVAEEFSLARDASRITPERNVLRYLPAETTVRIDADAPLHLTLRVLCAALASHSTPVISLAAPLPADVSRVIMLAGFSVHTESNDEWAKRVAQLAAADGPAASARIRLVSGSTPQASRDIILRSSQGKPDIAVYDGDVVSAGRIEMLPFLREQAVSVTAHRFGTPNPRFSADLFRAAAGSPERSAESAPQVRDRAASATPPN